MSVGIDVKRPEVISTNYSRLYGGRRVKAWVVPVALIKIGDEEIRKASLTVVDSIYDDKEIEMLLGADFFLSHRIYVAKALNRLYHTYNGGMVFQVASPVAP